MTFMESKSEFIERFKAKTKKMAVDVVRLINTLKACKSSNTIAFQIIKSATSTGANYRAACKARSENEFYAKISIVLEEADETLYWLEIIEELDLIDDKEELKRLEGECLEIIKVVTSARNKKYKK